MSAADDVNAKAAAILARLNPPAAVLEAASVSDFDAKLDGLKVALKPAPEPPPAPSMSVSRAREIMRAEGVLSADDLPPQTYEPWPPAPPPSPPVVPPTRWQRLAAWMNRPLLK